MFWLVNQVVPPVFASEDLRRALNDEDAVLLFSFWGLVLGLTVAFIWRWVNRNKKSRVTSDQDPADPVWP